MLLDIILWSLLLSKVVLVEEDQSIDSINISAIITDTDYNNTNNQSQVINFTVNNPLAMELSDPASLISYNYIATFLVENLSVAGDDVPDHVYTVDEVHSDQDGLSKLTVTDPHRLGFIFHRYFVVK